MFRRVFGLLGTGLARIDWTSSEGGLFFSSYILRFTRVIRSSGSCLTSYFLRGPLVPFFAFIFSSCFSVLGCSDCDSPSVSQLMGFFSGLAFSFSLPLPYFLLFFLALRPLLLPLTLSSPFLRYSYSSAYTFSKTARNSRRSAFQSSFTWVFSKVRSSFYFYSLCLFMSSTFSKVRLQRGMLSR